MKKVFQFVCQVQYVEQEGSSPVILCVTPQGQVLSVVSSFDDVSSVLEDTVASLKTPSE